MPISLMMGEGYGTLGRTRVVNLLFSTDKDYLFMTFRYVGDFLLQ